ncbi:Maf family protein [Cardiobacteriaceae bacterium TAE3-ERU3]|nr:Maf family protein [Cardiobacteriaceae bacterium TAE3-ERU3]
MNLILASASPRRRDLLAMLGLSARQIAADVDESLPLGTSLSDGVKLLAERKALTVAQLHPHAVVLAADTLVALDGRLFGKPQTADDAREMLRTLAGTQHEVATGFCICQGERVVVDVVVSRVRMVPFDEALIDAYIASGEPFGKAGAYAVQGKGAVLVAHIEGDFFNVVGLPLSSVAKALRSFGDNEFLQAFAGT